MVFARQIRALGKPEDVAIAISTSGNSPNIITGIEAAREIGLTTVALTGGTGGQLVSKVDMSILIPSANLARIQECYITIGHLICELVEKLVFADDSGQDLSIKTRGSCLTEICSNKLYFYK